MNPTTMTHAPRNLTAPRRKKRVSRKSMQAFCHILIAILAILLGIVLGDGLALRAGEDEVLIFQEPQAQDAPIITTLEVQTTTECCPPLLEIADLDPALQEAIFEMCHYDINRFCAVMAIAFSESRYNPDAVGDNGQSIGMMQINTAAQADRIQALGVTDLTDPLQNVAVAVDYLLWLEDNLGSADPYSKHAIYMAYNMGLTGCREALQNGISCTNYSTSTLATYHTYLEWMEVNGE